MNHITLHTIKGTKSLGQYPGAFLFVVILGYIKPIQIVLIYSCLPMTASKQIIGKIIKQQREKSNMTLQELADLLQVDRQYVWKLENGKVNMTLDYLDKIIHHLKSKREDFLNVNN